MLLQLTCSVFFFCRVQKVVLRVNVFPISMLARINGPQSPVFANTSVEKSEQLTFYLWILSHKDHNEDTPTAQPCPYGQEERAVCKKTTLPSLTANKFWWHFQRALTEEIPLSFQLYVQSWLAIELSWKQEGKFENNHTAC